MTLSGIISYKDEIAANRQLIITNKTTDEEIKTTTDTSGHYTFENLLPNLDNIFSKPDNIFSSLENNFVCRNKVFFAVL